MLRKACAGLIVALSVFIYSCSHRSHPSSSTRNSDAGLNIAAKPVVKKKPEPPLVKVIAVNDSAARKSVDGRLYYDVMGHRYWKNYKDGKYYLFNKSMYNDPAFKNPG